MLRHLQCVLVVCILVAWVLVAPQATAAPPCVALSVPEHGDADVSPALRELRVEFDQDMLVSGGWSICGGGEEFPEIAGKPRWDGARTLIVPVKLAAGHAYKFSINCPAALNTRGATGEAAEMTPVWFWTAQAESADATGGAAERGHGAGATHEQPTREEQRASIAALREVVRDRYAHADRLVKDWNALFGGHQDRMESAPTRAAFARAAATMLRAADDLHLALALGTGDHRVVFPTAHSHPERNDNAALLPRLVAEWRDIGHGVFAGRIGESVYVRIDAWTTDAAQAAIGVMLDAARAAESTKDALGAGELQFLIDVRGNGGGDELAAREVAAWFVDEARIYAKNRYRSPYAPYVQSDIEEDQERATGSMVSCAHWLVKVEHGWGPLLERTIEPAVAGLEVSSSAEDATLGEGVRALAKARVAVLMGQGCMSSCESFVLMMRQSGRSVLVGDRTYGSSGNPRAIALPNGVEVVVPMWQDFDANGCAIEGVGVEPDVRVQVRAGELATRDPVLDTAIQALHGDLHQRVK